MTTDTAQNQAEEKAQKKARRKLELDRLLEPRWRKVVRVMAYFAGVATVGGVLAAGSAYGSMKDGALEIGEELGKLDHIGRQTPIELNGQPIHVGSQVLDMSVTEALDRAEKLCDAGSMLSPPGPTGPSLDSDEMILETGGESIGKTRQEEDGRGVVLCFAPGDGEPPIDGIGDKIDRYMKFFETGDLADLGSLRYFFAKATDSGRTHVVRVWTEESFNLYAMTSLDGGDAPGSDPSDMPRPPQARRLMSATAEGTVYAARVYESKLTPEQLADAYDELMPERGWERIIHDGAARIYQRKDVSVFVTPTERDGRTLVSLLHMGYDPAVASVPAAQ